MLTAQKKCGDFIMNKHKILITGTGSLIGQAIIKSIIRSNLKKKLSLIGCDYFPDTIGSFWCDKNYILPDILLKENKEIWKKKVLEIITDENIELLFIGVDFELLLFAELKNEIEQKTNCKVIVSEKKTLEIGNDKFLTAEFLKENKLNYPKTVLYDGTASQTEIDYPFILKPRIGARSKGVYIINNENELKNNAKSIKNPIIQELIGDMSSEYTCGVLFLDNKVISSIALRRNLKEGNTSLAEFRKDFPDSVYDYIEKIANILKPFGSCNFQLRLNKNSEPYLFEINPRFSGTTYIRSLFGYNEVEYIINHFLNFEQKQFQLEEGIAYRYFEEKRI